MSWLTGKTVIVSLLALLTVSGLGIALICGYMAAFTGSDHLGDVAAIGVIQGVAGGFFTAMAADTL